MNKLWFVVPASTVVLSLLSSCKQTPNEPLILESIIVTSPARPALTYYGTFKRDSGSYSAINVMDSDGANQTRLYEAPATSLQFGNGPSWSPDGRSVCFSQHYVSGEAPDTMKIVDIPFTSSVNKGRLQSRSIVGLTSPSEVLSNPVSSSAAMGMIAYTVAHNNATSTLNVVSSLGGDPRSIWTVPGKVFGYCTWSPDDAKLAIWRYDGVYHGTVMIFSTSTWQYVDSIEVLGNMTGMEWSRAGTNKLAFGMSTSANAANYIYYCDPTTGAQPSTDGVEGICPTWSPNNSSIFCRSSKGLTKVKSFSNMTTVVAPPISYTVRWKH